MVNTVLFETILLPVAIPLNDIQPSVDDQIHFKTIPTVLGVRDSYF